MFRNENQLKYLNNLDIQELELKVETLVNKKIQDDFNLFKDNLIKSLSTLENIPTEINQKLELFCNEQKHLFYRDYKFKIIAELKTKLEHAVNFDIHSTIENNPDYNFNETKQRMYLEAYFINNKISEKAAKFLKIPKSTYHDWVSKNKELILSEERKGLM